MPMARVFDGPPRERNRRKAVEPSSSRFGSPKRSGGLTLFDFHRGMLHGVPVMASEEDRTRLIGEIARILREEPPVPDDARAGALAFIGWLARRMPGEIAHAAGVPEMLNRSAARASVLTAPVTRGLAERPAPAGRTLRARRLR